jgi:hypothetical protein
MPLEVIKVIIHHLILRGQLIIEALVDPYIITHYQQEQV